MPPGKMAGIYKIRKPEQNQVRLDLPTGLFCIFSSHYVKLEILKRYTEVIIMKKIKNISILLVLILTLAGCGSKRADIEINENDYSSLFEKIDDESDGTTETSDEIDSSASSDTKDIAETLNDDTALESEDGIQTEKADETEAQTTEINADDKTTAENESEVTEAADSEAEVTSAENGQDEAASAENNADVEKTTDADVENNAVDTNATNNASDVPTETPSDESNSADVISVSAPPQTGGHIVVIDPGHQSKAMTDKEPNGPGSTNMKMKVTGGTSGRTTGLAEYQLALDIGLKLKAELSNRGYTVVMTRESNDVSLSNVDRAQIANNAGAEAFIRIHANGSEDTSVNGAMTICQTPNNPYNAAYYSQSRKLSDCVLDSFVAATGCKKQYVWETDTMTGINWANVPSTIIEMGYMTNPTDDTNMANADYQQKMVAGIANGIDNYFTN